MARATVMSVDAVGLNSFVMVHWPEYIKLIMTAIMSSAEAVACVRRYLVEASVARGLGVFIMIGMKAIMFISKPIQASSQWELVATITVLRIRVVRRIIKMDGFISMGRM